MCIAIIATKDNEIIANIALKYFTIVNGAQHHPTHVPYDTKFWRDKTLANMLTTSIGG